MDKELCFRIDNDDLYLNQVLVDYDGIPIFFLCKGKEKNYLSLCVDCENYNYIVVEVSLVDIRDLLHGNIPMREVILKQNEYWMVFSGTEISDDVVEQKKMDDIDQSCLPKEDACYKVLTEPIRQYAEYIDKMFYRQYEECIDKMLYMQSDYISFSKLETDYVDKFINTTIELTKYKFMNGTTKILGVYSDLGNTIEEDFVKLDYQSSICINSIVAA